MTIQGFQENLSPVLLWSPKDQQPHSMIPSGLIDKAISYYHQKGHHHIAEDLENNQLHHHQIRAHRHVKHDQPKGILADGQVIRVYTAKNQEKTKVKLLRDGAKKAGDKSADEAYDGATATYTFLKEVDKTKSIDGKGYPLDNTVHYGRNYCNAFWDGDEMVYGDGDGKIFNRFTISIDVTGHEIGHGVTQDETGTKVSHDGQPTGVDYKGEAGGINEGLSDILGIQVKQYALKQTVDKSDWLIGDDLIKSIKGRAYALRSMSNPGTGFVDHPQLGTDSQLKNYGDYVAAAQQKAVDPHDSSGIVNKAFYETAMKLGGYAWDKAGRIYFETLPYLTFSETFSGIADKATATAQRIYGKGSLEEAAVIGGWKAVQVNL
jgi:Zn-dependent metalloprotease